MSDHQVEITYRGVKVPGEFGYFAMTGGISMEPAPFHHWAAGVDAVKDLDEELDRLELDDLL